MNNDECTPLQKRFCEEYALDYNGTRAYKAAYPSTKSDNSAAVGASRLLRKVKIQAYIKEYQSDIERACGVSKMMAVKQLANFAFNSFDQIHDTWIERKDFDKLSPEIKACIQEIDTKVLKKNIGTSDIPEIVDVEHIKLKLVDKRGALQDLAKMLGWNNPSVNINLNDDTPLMSPDEREAKIAALQAKLLGK